MTIECRAHEVVLSILSLQSPPHSCPHTPILFFESMEGFPGGSDSKKSVCDAGDPGSIPELGRSTGGGNGNPL